MDKNKLRIKIAVKNPSILKGVTGAMKDDVQLLMVNFQDTAPVDLMILELAEMDANADKQIHGLLDSGKAGEVFLLGENPDAGLLMKLMRIGVKEFFSLPLNPEEFGQALERFKKRAGSRENKPVKKNGRVISVVGSKGGVGTTTVSVNLAVSLASGGDKTSVTLFDMNTLFGEIPLFLDLTPKFHWGEITKNIERLDDTFLMNILAKHSSGVFILPSPSYLNGNNSPSAQVIERLLAQMRSQFDYIVVDAGQSLEDSTLRMLQQSDDVLLVSLLNMPCLSNTNRLIKSLTELGYVSRNQLKVVINRNLKKNEISLKEAEAGIEKEIFCLIPNDYQTSMAAINQGKPIHDIAPNSGISKSFEELAGNFLPMVKKDIKKKWFFA
jgi:pilus assembly protein CpaE